MEPTHMRSPSKPVFTFFFCHLFVTNCAFCSHPTIFSLQVVQLQSTERMQSLAPTVKEINAKFGQNKEAATAATNRLYKETNVNPLIGCLPALLQVCVYLVLLASCIGCGLTQEDEECGFMSAT